MSVSSPNHSDYIIIPPSDFHKNIIENCKIHNSHTLSNLSLLISIQYLLSDLIYTPLDSPSNSTFWFLYKYIVDYSNLLMIVS